MSNPLKTWRVTNVHLTLNWNCSHLLCLNMVWRLKKKMPASFQGISRPLDSLEQGRTNNWILMIPMLALVNSVWDCWLKWLCCEVEIITQTALQASFIIWIYELNGNELVILLSFVSSNNTDKETAEQFITLYTRYVCDLSGLTSFSISETLETWRKLKKTFLSYFLFFAKFSCFSSTMNSWCFQLKEVLPQESVCLFQRLIIGQFIGKSCFTWPPVCLLLVSDHKKGVLIFFLCFRSELATEVVQHRKVRSECSLPSAISEKTGFCILSLSCIDFAVRVFMEAKVKFPTPKHLLNVKFPPLG